MKRAGLLRRMAWLAMAGGLLAGPAVSPAAAIMYQWTAPDGSIGLTDDPGRIPEQYRATAKPYQSPDMPPASTPPSGAAPESDAPSSVATTAPATADVDNNGHDRAWWRDRVKTLTDQRADLTGQRNKLEEKFNQLYYFGTETIGELQLQQSLREQLDDLAGQISDIDQQLTSGLPDEARRAGAPPGWVRD